MSAQQQQIARPATNPLARPASAVRRIELARHRVVASAAAVVPPPPAIQPVPRRVRVPRIQHCSFCFSNDGHNIGTCTHIDVEYLYWEMMYFYRHYGEHFLCNNLSVLFQPTEVHALLNYHPIKNTRLVNENEIWARMIVDTIHSPAVSRRYELLHKKIVSISHNPIFQYGRMDIVEPVMYHTIHDFETQIGERIDYATIITGYHHTFTSNRHARFRRYDYDMAYLEEIPNDPRELSGFHAHYLPPPMFGETDMGRYGFARINLVTLDTDPVATSTSPVATDDGSVASVSPNTESRDTQQPEWMMHNTRRMAATFTFEEIAFITRLFEDNYKNAQPETEVKVVEKILPEKMEECPICMVEIKHSESVSLGCCVYSFCSDCYANQYLTKEHRAHNCMMCRTPFSQIEVYHESIAEKLRVKCPASIIQERAEIDDDGHYGLPMTLAELS